MAEGETEPLTKQTLFAASSASQREREQCHVAGFAPFSFISAGKTLIGFEMYYLKRREKKKNLPNGRNGQRGLAAGGALPSVNDALGRLSDKLITFSSYNRRADECCIAP